MNENLFELFEFNDGGDKSGEVATLHLASGHSITGELIDLDVESGFVAIGNWRVLLSSVIAVGDPE